jgi:hypothetical protein
MFGPNKNILKECVPGSNIKEAAIDYKALVRDIKKLSFTKLDFDHYVFCNKSKTNDKCYL